MFACGMLAGATLVSAALAYHGAASDLLVAVIGRPASAVTAVLDLTTPQPTPTIETPTPEPTAVVDVPRLTPEQAIALVLERIPESSRQELLRPPPTPDASPSQLDGGQKRPPRTSLWAVYLGGGKWRVSFDLSWSFDQSYSFANPRRWDRLTAEWFVFEDAMRAVPTDGVAIAVEARTLSP